MLHVLSSQAPLDWSMNSDGHMAPSPRVSMVLHTPPDSPHKCSADRNTDETKERVRPSTTRRPRVFDGIRVSIRSKNNRQSRNSFTTKSSPSRKSMQSRPSECQPSETKMSVPSSSSERDNFTSSQRIATKTNPWKRLTTIVHKTPVTPMYSISFSPWRTPLDEYSSETSADWVPDTASTRCQTCLAAFGITRRRHHCRLCGGLVCNNCSLQRTFVAMSHESRRSRSANLSHRTCNTCATTLKNMATQYDSRVKFLHSETITETQKTVGTRYSERNRTVRVSWDRERQSLTKENRQQRQQLSRARATTKNAPARHEEFEKVLQARSMSRGNSKTEQHIISSVWLEEWLKYVQFESGGRSNTGGYRGGSSNRNRPMIVRRPGPISNYSLLNFVSGVLEPKEDLQRNRGTEENGDYHVISREVWLVLLKMYGGGPSIHLKDVEVADQSQTSKSTALVSSKVALTASYTELGSKWVIKELNNEISNALADAQADTQAKSVSSELIPVEEQQQLAVRSTAPNFFSRKWLHNSKSARGDRHISSSALVLTSTSHEQENAIESSNERRRSFWKNWRSTEDNAFNKGTASTISQISEDVILFDPTKVEIDDNYSAMCIEESIDEINSTPNLSPTKSIAAISAFALAAAEARRKSTMSLMRHSSALMSQTNTMSA